MFSDTKKLPHVLVFDSGAGGLSIAQTLIETSPIALKMSYLADNGAFPYGNKAESFLIPHISELLGRFITKLQPDIVVIACNTASTIALPELRKRYLLPFVGVVPAIKPAANISTTKCIGVLATPATVKRDYTSSLIEEFAPECKVFLHGSNNLVHYAEQFVSEGWIDVNLVQEEVNKLLKQEQSNNIDTVVLACTHFPLIAAQIKASAPSIQNWVDSGLAVANRTLDLLKKSFDFELKKSTIKASHNIEIYFEDNSEPKVISVKKENFNRYLLSGKSQQTQSA